MAGSLALVVHDVVIDVSRVDAALAAAQCARCFARTTEALVEVLRLQPDLVIVVATGEEPERAIACLTSLHACHAQARYVFVAGVSSEDLAIGALNAGAHRYVREPWTPDTLAAEVRRLVPSRPLEASACDRLAGGDRLVGRSERMRQLRSQIAMVASATSNVLILGETGTGKELVAELIHQNGPRARKPLVCMNTAAIPDSLLENELFGHERGAFTGATSAEVGKLAAAHGGTIFLDEIGDVSLAIQAKLLRAIENKSIYRLGGSRSVQLDVRVLAATNGDLEQAIAAGKFRRDLYYRLNVVRIELPALRERIDDIPVLVDHYLRRLNRELHRDVRGLSARAMDTLRNYSWPGNVRELRNVIEALLVHMAPETTGIVDVPPQVMRQLAVAVGAPQSERARLLDALTSTNWNKTRAASQLNVSRMTLYRKMHQHAVGMRR